MNDNRKEILIFTLIFVVVTLVVFKKLEVVSWWIEKDAPHTQSIPIYFPEETQIIDSVDGVDDGYVMEWKEKNLWGHVIKRFIITVLLLGISFFISGTIYLIVAGFIAGLYKIIQSVIKNP
ncbi:MAG: hypothetical protein ACLFQE_06445 [Thermotogota bacterium]